jgi:GxxExxY protein
VTQDAQTYRIIGAAMEVHRELGCGFLEPVYQEALGLEFERQGIEAQAQVQMPIHYKGIRLETTYRADFVCFGSVIIELKALRALTPVEDAQVLNYLHASKRDRGLLFNFGNTSLQKKRFVLSQYLSG